jgi:hypothetical protein
MFYDDDDHYQWYEHYDVLQPVHLQNFLEQQPEIKLSSINYLRDCLDCNCYVPLHGLPETLQNNLCKFTMGALEKISQTKKNENVYNYL